MKSWKIKTTAMTLICTLSFDQRTNLAYGGAVENCVALDML